MAGGYHSIDARGVTKAVDPAPPLVRAKRAEVGLRSFAIPYLETQVAVFMLDLASELEIIGDAGTTVACGATRRVGVEWVNLYHFNPWLTTNTKNTNTHGRFK